LKLPARDSTRTGRVAGPFPCNETIRSGGAGKRAFDLALTLASLPFWLPLLGLMAVAVRWSLGSPVFFRQTRIGRSDRPFVLLKFRTMTDERTASGALAPDEVRLTRAGKFLRQASLDELPQLINVVRGDMSLIGPRPLLPQYLPRYSPGQRRRHEVKPGITGWAQINGRNNTTWEKKFELDVWYVDHWSLALDLKILAMTIVKVLRRDGISQSGQATMEEFMGSAEFMGNAGVVTDSGESAGRDQKHDSNSCSSAQSRSSKSTSAPPFSSAE